MGKIVTVYLTDDVASDLRSFCDENKCTQYSTLKTVLRDLIYKPVTRAIDEEPTDHKYEPADVQPPEVETEEGTNEENEQIKKEGTSNTHSLLKRLLEQYRTRENCIT